MKYLLVLIILYSSLSAKTGEELNNEMACPQTLQENSDTSKGLFVCPSLPNYNNGGEYDLTHSLDKINFQTGEYTCTYRYGGKQFAQSCSFQSGAFQKIKKDVQVALRGYSGKDRSVSFGKFNLANGGANTYASNNYLDFDSLFNNARYGVSPPDYIAQLQASVNEVHEKLKNMVVNKTGAPASSDRKKLQNVSTNLKKIKELTNKVLVEPYFKPDLANVLHKENTFSNFLAGLVTLDNRMIEGYNEDTGELIINNDWKLKATSISQEERLNINGFSLSAIGSMGNTIARGWAYVSSWLFDTAMPDAQDEAKYKQKQLSLPNNSTKSFLNMSSWVDIFELKLWGFYYNVQRRFDIGYDVMSTQLLYIMSLWFILMGGTRAGIGHLINREQGAKVSEDNWLKIISVMVGVGVFFISLPSPITSTGANGGNIEGSSYITNEMNKNRTIMKYVIRESAQFGANWGTMMSDLGLDAFLSYVINKQEIYDARQISNSFQNTVAQLDMYYPALAIAKECRDYFIANDNDFYSVNPKVINNVSDTWKDGSFGVKNNVSSISYALCRKAVTMIALTPYELFLNNAETTARIENVDEVMAVSVYQLAYNNVAIQSKMGWINTFNVPVTYFLMKHGDMFLTTGIDQDKIAKLAKAQVRSLDVRDSSDTDYSSVSTPNAWRITYTAMSDTAQQWVATASSYMSHFLLYNMLPAFSGIQKGVQDYLDKVYGDFLEIHQTAVFAKKSGTSGSVSSIADFAKGIFKKTASIAFSPIKKLVSFLPIDVEDAFAWRTLIFIVSYLLAIYTWKLSFTVIFISTVAIMLLLKTVLYFKDLMVHTISSIFVLVWAFTKQGGQGEQKMVGFVRDTLILMIYPTLIVLGAYTFVFVYELFTTVYTYLMVIMLEGQKATISLMGTANSDTDSFTSYMNVESIGYLSAILVDIFGLFIALITIMKFPEYVLKKMGINENETMMISSTAEAVSQRGEKFSNPM